MKNIYTEGVFSNFIGSLVGGILGTIFTNQNIVLVAIYSAIGTFAANIITSTNNKNSIFNIFKLENIATISMFVIFFVYSHHFFLTQFFPKLNQMNFFEIILCGVLSIGCGYLLGAFSTAWLFIYLQTIILEFNKFSWKLLFYIVAVPLFYLVAAKSFELNTNDIFFKTAIYGLPPLLPAVVLLVVFDFGE